MYRVDQPCNDKNTFYLPRVSSKAGGEGHSGQVACITAGDENRVAPESAKLRFFSAPPGDGYCRRNGDPAALRRLMGQGSGCRSHIQPAAGRLVPQRSPARCFSAFHRPTKGEDHRLLSGGVSDRLSASAGEKRRGNECLGKVGRGVKSI